MTASLLDLKFIGALCVVVLFRRVWPDKHYAILGALSSALIIGLAAPQTLLAISAITVLFILPWQGLTQLARRSLWPKPLADALMPAGIISLVLVLVIFKVYRQFTVPWIGGPWLQQNLLALIGFSYFIFRAIDYMHIQIILKPQKIRIWDLLFYLLFPPTISSGPIHKYQDFSRQIEHPEPLRGQLVLRAAYRVTRGFFRKTVIAVIIDRILQDLLAASSLPLHYSVLALILLFLFFYFDFAGYSDIAIGFGLLLGIRVPENFRKPFLATSITEFWRNWHITLVDWFRDHVFIPLGGMRGTRLQAASLALLIMVLCGFWHGLNISMIAWGVWHGVNMFGEAMLGIRPVAPGLRSGPVYWFRVLGTNARAAFGCVFFLPGYRAIMKVLEGFAVWKF